METTKKPLPPVLVFYVDVDNMSVADIAPFITKMREATRFKDDYDVLQIYVPLRGKGAANGTRVECINPQLVSEEEYQKITAMVDVLQKAVDDLVPKVDEK